jgi:integrase
VAFAEQRGGYFRGRYKVGPGKYATVQDEQGRTIKFPTKRKAVQAATEEEQKAAREGWRDPAQGLITFGEYVNRWFAAQDLASTTMQNYRRDIEAHLLPVFGTRPLKTITPHDIAVWEREEKAAGYGVSSISTYRSRLHLVLADAVDEELISGNPAARRRGRGRRAGRTGHRGPEKVIASPLKLLLIAERLSILAGRNDEFVACVLKGYTGMRWAEVVGLEAEFVREQAVRVEWQLVELDDGTLERCPPKDDSFRTLDLPTWLSELLAAHLARTAPRPCVCHGRTYVFRSFGAVRRWGRGGGTTVKDIARLAGVSAGTVSNVLNWPERVTAQRRERVQAVIEEVGYFAGRTPEETAAHWRRKGFADRLFRPAVTGSYPAVGVRPGRLVPLGPGPWPGALLRGRGADERATACWVPMAPGLTPHGLRHSHRTQMENLGTERVLMDERMGHIDGSVSARYAHVTDQMRVRLVDGLTRDWNEALAARRALDPGSAVAALDALLKA